MLTGVPLLMGEHPGQQIAKAEVSMAKIERALRPVPSLRARPLYRPRVRSLSLGLYLRGHAAVPNAPSPHADGSGQSLDQRRCVCRVTYPGPFCGCPSQAGASASPTCTVGCAPGTFGFLRAMDSRSVPVRENVRALCHPYH